MLFLEHKLLSEQLLDYLGGGSRPTVDFSGVVPPVGAAGEVALPLQQTLVGRRGCGIGGWTSL